MFESAELGHQVDKETYNTKVPKLREALLRAQGAMLEAAKYPLIVVVGGVDGAGKGETVHTITEWMDPRLIEVHAFADGSDEERDRPAMWRFWRALPPKGKTAIFFGSWYSSPIAERIAGDIDDDELDSRATRIVRFEQMLVAEGAAIVKLWMHLSKSGQKKRLRDLESNPLTSWRVTDVDWKQHKHYDHFRSTSERMLRETSTGEAPWIVIEGTDHRYRVLSAGEAILRAMESRAETVKTGATSGKKRAIATARVIAKPSAPPLSPLMPAIDGLGILGSLDLTKKLDHEKYDVLLEKHQRRLSMLCRDARFAKRSAVFVFEGVDAGGKGGAIRRVVDALDSRHYRIVPIAAPTDEERAQPYLWRFWRNVPARDRITIFDRSWYGRVLVERVEKLASELDWMRAFGEINDFETQLDRHGTIVVKLWLQISQKEQLRRFREREKVGFKRFKITREDWRNRRKWPDYEVAIGDMIDRTSTERAPWTVVEAEDKRFARIKVIETIADRIEAAIG